MKLKNILSVAMLAGATLAAGAGVANAEVTLSGNVALTTDYLFRGLSQTQHAPAIQGGFDLSAGQFYAGTWASNIDFGSAGPLSVNTPMELDVYAGFKPTIGPISADFGVIGYLYPGADDNGLLASGEFNYYELKAAGSITPAAGFTLGAAAYFSPEFPGNGGNSWYTELNAAYTVSDSLAISGAVGHQTVDTSGYFVTTGGSEDAYTTWNVGATYSTHGFGIDLRYVGNSVDDITNIVGETVSDNTVVLTLKRAL